MTKTLLICTVVFLCSSAFLVFKKPKVKLPKQYTYISGGTFWDGPVEYRWPDPEGKRATVWSFYMSMYEVTNLQYREFLNDVSKNLSKEEIEKIKVDSTGWDTIPFSYGEPYRPNYFRFPAFNNYPVVNITHTGAMQYCTWLQQKLQKDNPDFEIIVKLPSRLQWVYAAKGMISYGKYPWVGNTLRDKQGKFLCNFNFIDETAIVRNKETGTPEIDKNNRQPARSLRNLYTDNVENYQPNGFKLYNMSGNVAEMIDTVGVCMGGSWNDFGGDVTVVSQAKYDKPSAMLGFRPIIIVNEIGKN